jgi:hypothetical protein
MIFLQNKALASPLPPCLSFASGLIKDVGGACIVRLTKLPPSKHVLMQSTPLIFKNNNKLRDCNEFKYKFRGVFAALKTNVGRKCFLTTFILVLLVSFASIS